MLCLAERFIPSSSLWQKAARTGADRLWRTRQNARLDLHRRLPDGSCLSRIYASTSDRRNERHGIIARVIDDRLKDVARAEPVYRLRTTILDPRSGRQPKNWPRRTPKEGRAKPRWTNSKSTSAARRSCCAARPRSWSSRSTGASSWRTTRSVACCRKRPSRLTKTATDTPTCPLCGWSNAGWPALSLRPPRQIKALPETVLGEFARTGGFQQDAGPCRRREAQDQPQPAAAPPAAADTARGLCRPGEDRYVDSIGPGMVSP